MRVLLNKYILNSNTIYSFDTKSLQSLSMFQFINSFFYLSCNLTYKEKFKSLTSHASNSACCMDAPNGCCDSSDSAYSRFHRCQLVIPARSCRPGHRENATQPFLFEERRISAASFEAGSKRNCLGREIRLCRRDLTPAAVTARLSVTTFHKTRTLILTYFNSHALFRL